MWIKLNDDFFNLKLVAKITVRRFDENTCSLRFTFADGDFVQITTTPETVKNFIKTIEPQLKPIAKFRTEEIKTEIKTNE